MFCSAFAGLYCERLTDCRVAEASRRSDCEVLKFRECDLAVGRYVRNGVAHLGPAAESECASGLGTARCEELGSARDHCLYGPHGRSFAAAGGKPCEHSSQCVDGYCDYRGDACSICQPFTPVGAICGYCNPNVSYCQLPSQTDGGAAVCVPLLSDGSSCITEAQCPTRTCNLDRICGLVAVGRACRSLRECTADAYCKGVRYEPMTSGICTQRFDAGTPCTRDSNDPWGGCMGPDYFCLDGVCRAPGLHGVADGMECASHLQCATGSECAGLSGSYSGRCAPVGAPGDVCGGQLTSCRYDAVCVKQSDGGARCVDLKGEGEPCLGGPTQLEQCRVGLFCHDEGTGGRCEPLRSEKSPGTSDRACLTSSNRSGRDPGSAGCIGPISSRTG